MRGFSMFFAIGVILFAILRLYDRTHPYEGSFIKYTLARCILVIWGVGAIVYMAGPSTYGVEKNISVTKMENKYYVEYGGKTIEKLNTRKVPSSEVSDYQLIIETKKTMLGELVGHRYTLEIPTEVEKLK